MPIQTTAYAVPREDLGEAIREYNPSPDGFIANLILPIRAVKKKAATASVIGRENMKRSDSKHANGASFNRVNLNAKDLAYACEDHGLEGPLTDTDRANYENDFDAELETVMNINRKIMIEQEIRVAAMIFDPVNNWPSGTAALYTDVSSAPWDAAASDVILHVLAAKEKVRANTGMVANAMIIGAKTMNNLLGNTAIKARFPGTPLITEVMIRQNLAAIFGLDQLLVGQEAYDSAKEGQSFSASDVWSDDYALICRINQGSIASGGLGRTFLWSAITPDNVTVDMYRENQTKSDIFRVNQFLQEKIFDTYFGHLLKIDA